MLSLKSPITKQQSIFTKPKQQSKAATVASIKVAHLLAKKKKPFIDAEIMQEAMLVVADSLFDDFKNKTEILGAVNMLQLSARTATRRIELIASNLEAKLANDVETCEFFKMVFDDFSTKEELLKILPLTACTQGKDIFSLFKKFAIENKLPLKKLSSITTDGAQAMTVSETVVGERVWNIGMALVELMYFERGFLDPRERTLLDCKGGGRERETVRCFGSKGIELFWTGGKGILSMREQPQGVVTCNKR
ncbi:zinc finger BED domain-containing protein 5-like [Trichonephila clavipes]|nr:zinc finger BED domain-containing protein 5-like [Trichonephila clavipes]